MERRPHVLVVPYPAQGHVIPMLELSQWLAKHGVRVTFANTEFNHQRVIASLSDLDDVQRAVSMVSIWDGLEEWEDRNDLARLTEAISRVVPGELEALVEKLNGTEEKVVCVIGDGTMPWGLEVADKIGARKVAFWPAAAAALAMTFNIPMLLSDGIVDSNGLILKDQMVQLSPNIPLMSSANFAWACMNDPATRKSVFDLLVRTNDIVKSTDVIKICNSSHDLEPGTFSLYPDIPIGPLLASGRLGKTAGSFWPEDSASLAWLDRQPANSVIYVAFGSFALFDKAQFDELALGLELTNRPFLWVVRRDGTDEVYYPEGFEDRVRGRGMTVGWAPQQQVLSHPSVACFVSHCGWNSTVEGVGNGLPFLCWPYFADQFLNRSYICDEWRVGLGLRKDESGVVRRGEIKDKLERVMSEKGYKERALDLKAKIMGSVGAGGSSCKNFNEFIEWIKG